MPIPDLPLFRHRDTVVTPADQNQFVTQFENTMDTMSNDVIPALNLSINDMNTQYNNIYNNLPFAPDSGYSQAYIDANIYKKTETYNKTEVDAAINNSSQINTLTDKPTPDDTDNFALQEVGGDLKKVSFLNIQNVLQVVYAENNIVGSGSLTIPADGTIPQITEGNEILTCTITPKKANSRLLIEFTPSCQDATGGGDNLTVACFRNGVPNSLYQTSSDASSGLNVVENSITGRFIINTPSTDTLTFSLRAGLSVGVIRWNELRYNSSIFTPTFTTITITEIL